MRQLLVIALVFGALIAFVIGIRNQKQIADGDSPTVTAQLRVGYGLSVTPRPGWVPVTYRDKTWWVDPKDITHG